MNSVCHDFVLRHGGSFERSLSADRITSVTLCAQCPVLENITFESKTSHYSWTAVLHLACRWMPFKFECCYPFIYM